MSRVTTVFFSGEAVREKGPAFTAMDIQIGDEILVWVEAADSNVPLGLPGFLVGMHLDVDVLSFDVAFEVAQTGVYVVARNLLSRITRRDEDSEGRKVGSSAPTRTPARPPALQVVVSNKHSQLAQHEQACEAAQTESSEPLVESAAPRTDWVSAFRHSAVDNGPISVEYLCGEADWVEFKLGCSSRAVEAVGEDQETLYVMTYPSTDMASADIARFESSYRGIPLRSARWSEGAQCWRWVTNTASAR